MKLGRTLTWDHARGAVVGDDEANALLTRPYRGPGCIRKPRIFEAGDGATKVAPYDCDDCDD